MMPTTEGGLDLKLDLTHVIDGFHGNEHTLPITPLYKDVLQIFAQSGISETPTLIVNYGGPFGEDYWYEYTEVHDNAKLNHFTPHKIIDEKTKRRPAWFRKDEYAFPKLSAQVAKLAARRRIGRSRQPRPAAGAWLSLGNVDARERRHDADGSAALRDGEWVENYRAAG